MLPGRKLIKLLSFKKLCKRRVLSVAVASFNFPLIAIGEVPLRK